jgi:nucleotide sugar dehydrogenase
MTNVNQIKHVVISFIVVFSMNALSMEQSDRNLPDKTKVCVIGLGYVGLTLGTYLASYGEQVHGIDRSDVVLDSLRNNRAHFYEEGFDELLSKVLTNGALTFGKDYSDDADVYIVTVGTSLGANKKVNYEAIYEVSNQLAKRIKPGALIIFRSTLKIGTIRNIIKPILDRANKKYYLAYCPERTLEGNAIHELANLPQIISGIDEDSLTVAKNFFSSFSSEVVTMNSVEEAEMVKLLNNSERDLMFALANEIALMCMEKNLNAQDVIRAANYKYPRSNLKKPGLVGGPCLEKDPYILTESFEETNYRPQLFTMGRHINEKLVILSLNKICDRWEHNHQEVPKRIVICGFAFKGMPATNDMRGSLVIPIISYLKTRFPDATLVGHDYLVSEAEIAATGVLIAASLQEAINGADLIILQNNHPKYKSEKWDIGESAFIFDFWNQLDPTNLPELRARYFQLGNIHGVNSENNSGRTNPGLCSISAKL